MPTQCFHTVLLTPRGEVFSSGWNNLGQLGFGDTITRKEYNRVDMPGKCISVAAGHDGFSLAVGENGTLWGFGDNYNGLDKSLLDFIFSSELMSEKKKQVN